MGVAHPRLASPSWLRLPRRTARLRLTALYGGLFLLSGAALGAITYVLFERATEYRTPPIPKIPRTPAIENLQLPSPLAPLGLLSSSTCSRISWHRPESAGPGPASAGGTACGSVCDTGPAADTGPASADTGPASAGPVRASAGPVRASAGPGRDRPSRAARGRLAPASGQLGNRPGHRGRTRPPGRLARRRPDAATHPDHHPHGPKDLLHQPARAPRPRRPAKTSSRNSGTPSTASSRGSKPPSRPNDTSSPTPPTSCAPP